MHPPLRSAPPLGLTLRTCLVAGVALLAAGVAWSAPPARLSPQLVSQIQSIRTEKAARTPAQRKISSRLLHARKLQRRLPIAPGVASLRTGVEVASDGTVLVDLEGEVTPTLLARIETLGGRIVNHHARYRAIRAHVPLADVESLAERSDVQSIRPAGGFMTHKINTSEGDVRHRADLLRATYSIDGSGVTIGVISDGVTSLAARQATGDLPVGVTVLSGQEGSGDEGTAMLEIVFDLAPGANLLFATALGGQAQFASNILALAAAGADVIVDDVGYFAEAVFQDDDVADAVNTVTAAGVLYFSSAGNSGNLNDGTAGVWEGDYAFSGTNVNGEPSHDFGSGDYANEITDASPFVYTLHWSDPIAGSGNDYDLLLADAGLTTLIAISDDRQDGNDDPFEIIAADSSDVGRNLLVVKFGGADRFLHLNVNRGEIEHVTDGQTAGHSAARDAYSVAAVDVRPVIGAFTGTEPVEPFSSDGPRRVFYEADGTPITPGDVSASGGELRAKPDLAAGDCVLTSTPGFGVFCGTSAAAPHAAAIAALLLEIAPDATPSEVRAALAGTALDIEASGPDRDSGAGIVDALAAGAALAECGVDGDCSDGLFCTGTETCVAFACVGGPGDPCTGSSEPVCDEATDACICLVDGDCSDGLFCTGAESCIASACVAEGTDPCAGGPEPVCDELGDVCVECLVDGNCDDTLFCTGTETCTANFCAPGTGDPCTAGEQGFCDELGDECVSCLVDTDCGDGLFCNGVEFCAAGACISQGDACALSPDPFCDEATDACLACLVDADCDDGAFCSGAETCSAGACIAGGGDPCLAGSFPLCDEFWDVCGECLVADDCSEGETCGSNGRCAKVVPATPLWSRGLMVAALIVLTAWIAVAAPQRRGRGSTG